MFKKIKEYLGTKKSYREAKKAVTLMLFNQYNDFLSKELEVKDAELRVYESMTLFEDTFKPEDLQNMLTSINKIANNPNLTTSYYEKIREETHPISKNISKVK